MTLETPSPIVIGQPLSDSAFYMWRCIVALAHADGQVQDEELEYIDKVFAGMEKDSSLTAEQREILGEDLVTPQKIADLLKHVTTHGDRHQLIYFAALMAQSNGELDPGEEAIIRQISDGELSQAETGQLFKDVRKALDDKHMQEALAKAYAERPKGLRAIVRFVVNKIYGIK
jgi:uncharacterized membrane protein YebE (DUF533 family)